MGKRPRIKIHSLSPSPSPLFLSVHKSSSTVPGKHSYSVRFTPSPHLYLEPKTKQTSLNQKVSAQKKKKVSAHVKILTKTQNFISNPISSLPPPLSCEPHLSESYDQNAKVEVGLMCHPRQLHVPRAPKVHSLYMASNSLDLENTRSCTVT